MKQLIYAFMIAAALGVAPGCASLGRIGSEVLPPMNEKEQLATAKLIGRATVLTCYYKWPDMAEEHRTGLRMAYTMLGGVLATDGELNSYALENALLEAMTKGDHKPSAEKAIALSIGMEAVKRLAALQREEGPGVSFRKLLEKYYEGVNSGVGDVSYWDSTPAP